MNSGLGRFFVLLLLIISSGCAVQTVQPWERGRLAERRMAFDPDPQLASYRNHVHFSKEGSSARLSAAGGGCGCN